MRIKRKPKKNRALPRLGKKMSDEKAIGWATRHDVFDRVKSGVSEIVDDHDDLDRLLEESVFQVNSAQLNMRIPAAMKALLGKLARQRTTDATTLARIWLAERLQHELRTRR
jgi:hypothetical protein